MQLVSIENSSVWGPVSDRNKKCQQVVMKVRHIFHCCISSCVVSWSLCAEQCFYFSSCVSVLQIPPRSSCRAACRVCSPTLWHLQLSVKFTFSTPLFHSVSVHLLGSQRGILYERSSIDQNAELRQNSVILYWRAGQPVALMKG